MTARELIAALQTHIEDYGDYRIFFEASPYPNEQIYPVDEVYVSTINPGPFPDEGEYVIALGALPPKMRVSSL